MTTTPTTIKLTYEDYVCFPDDGKRHELIDGEHHVTPAPLTKHQRISMNLGAALHDHCQQTNAGRLFAAPTDVCFTDTDVVQPDLLLIAHDRAHLITRENIQGAPDLIVEILSDSPHDGVTSASNEPSMNNMGSKNIGSWIRNSTV